MNKLSRHVLGMKFMKRTQQQVVTEKTESTFRHHFAPKTEPGKSRSKSKFQNKVHKSFEIQEIGSYSQCEGHIFGRQSYGGFNPVVEYNVSRGIWKPFSQEEEEDGDDKSEEIKTQVKSDEDSEVDVPDKEMAKTFGSLVGTLGKRFLKKRKRGEQQLDKNIKTESQQSRNDKKNDKFGKKSEGRWNKRNAKDEDKATNSNYHPSEKNEDAPPTKKLKFQKPLD